MRRRLKIAWTVFFAVLTVALCVLWVRSYWTADTISTTWWTGSGTSLSSASGDFEIYVIFDASGLSAAGWTHRDARSVPKRDHRFLWAKGSHHIHARVPYWLVVLLSVSLCATAWLRLLPFRFSLRAMLIATTLVAVVLGLIVWTARR